MLNCETNTRAMERRILRVFSRSIGQRHDVSADFEHGQWFVTCLLCGGQWSVCDSNAEGGFDFERITEGDGFCDE